MNRPLATCQRCGNLRPDFGGLCNSCKGFLRRAAREPTECPRCHRVRKPFSKGMCQSCYQVLQRKPDASTRGSDTHRQRISESQQYGPNRRERSGKWNGGRFVDATGYVRVIRPDDYNGPCIHGGRYVHEHRYVAEQKIGRALQEGEIAIMEAFGISHTRTRSTWR